jgi:hypothetical protein
MKARFLALGIVIGLLLALTLGFAYRGSASMMGWDTGPRGSAWATMEAMHDSPGMRAMHERMPDELQARCDELHDRMTSSGFDGMMGSGGMMGS